MKNRPQRLISFLVVWLTMFSCLSLSGQNLFKKDDLSPDFKHLWLPGVHAQFQGPDLKNPGGPGLSSGILLAGSMNSEALYVIPSNIYYCQSGYFCKREWELEKATHIPFRVRLGSLADCNAMEGKH
jgi:hypothetical protein